MTSKISGQKVNMPRRETILHDHTVNKQYKRNNIVGIPM